MSQMRLPYLFLLFTALGLLTGCDNDISLKKEILETDVSFEMIRFDSLFYDYNNEIDYLIKSFPYLFPKNIGKEVWLEKRTDSIEQKAYNEIKKVFSDFKQYQEQINLTYKSYKYYFPNAKVPKTITLKSDFDYKNRVIYADSLMLIGIETFLGANSYLYENIFDYIKFSFNPIFLAPKIAEAIAYKIVGTDPGSNLFLEQIIFHGKALYIKSKLIEVFVDKNMLESLTMNYSIEQVNWAKKNEKEIWKYFITENILFGTNPKLQERFISDGPFSKFYLKIDNFSPGRIGTWIGKNIVKSYAEHNIINNLQEIVNIKAEDLFKNSKYKPSR